MNVLSLGVLIASIGLAISFRKALLPWVRISIDGDEYSVSVPRGRINGKHLCLLTLSYYVRLRAVIPVAPNEAGQKAFDAIVLRAARCLLRNRNSPGLHLEEELLAMLPSGDLGHASSEPHNLLRRTVSRCRHIWRGELSS